MIMIVVNDTPDQTYTVEVSVLSNFNSGYMHLAVLLEGNEIFVTFKNISQHFVCDN